MRKSKAVECAGKTRVVQELTPAQVDALFDQSATGPGSIVDAFLDVHDLNVILLAAMVQMEPAELERELQETVPSEYGKLIAAAKEINPDFFAMARQRKELAGQLETLERMLVLASDKGSASSSSADTTMPGIMA